MCIIVGRSISCMRIYSIYRYGHCILFYFIPVHLDKLTYRTGSGCAHRASKRIHLNPSLPLALPSIGLSLGEPDLTPSQFLLYFRFFFTCGCQRHHPHCLICKLIPVHTIVFARISLLGYHFFFLSQ